MKHLPVEEATPAQIPKLSAWLANRRGDRVSEQRALERLIEADPIDFAALDRLAGLAIEEGRPAQASDLQRRKTEILQLQNRYQALYQHNQPIRNAEQMAGLAVRLGRGFEARVFGTLAVAADPHRDDLRRQLTRLNQQVQTGDARGQTWRMCSPPSSNPSRPPHPQRARPHQLGTSRWPRLRVPTSPNDPSGRIPADDNSSSSESDQAVRRTCRFSSPCPLADSVWFPLLIVSPLDRSKPFFRFLELVWKHRAMKRNGARPTIMMKPMAAASNEATGRTTSGEK